MNLIYNSVTKEEDHKEYLFANSEYPQLVQLEKAWKDRGFKSWVNPYDKNHFQLVVIKKGTL